MDIVIKDKYLESLDLLDRENAGALLQAMVLHALEGSMPEEFILPPFAELLLPLMIQDCMREERLI